MADAGFDVWLGNVRGNVYSRKHVKYTRSDKEYWEFSLVFFLSSFGGINTKNFFFSWDEMAEYDLETMINTVLYLTEQRSLYYMGHSQGTEIMFAKLSSDAKFAKKVKLILND